MRASRASMREFISETLVSMAEFNSRTFVSILVVNVPSYSLMAEVMASL